jgi:dihydrofolate reductase
MGRKTFDSIGKPLPNRRNIVLTRNATWRHDGVEVVHSFHQALELIGGIKAFIIGGAELFRQALPLCDQILATEIQHHFNCDAFFTPIDKNDWKETERETHYSEKNQFEYAFVTYSRIRKH